MQVLQFLMLFVLLLLSGLTVQTRLLNKPAAASGALIAWMIWLGTGLTGLVMLAVFFIAGAGATRWSRFKRKGTTENFGKKADRSAIQVWANVGLAALAGITAFFFPEAKVYCLLVVAAILSAACSDTLSSELGTLYGRRFYNFLSGQPDQRGADGVVSLEGLGIGWMASMVMAMVYGLLQTFTVEVLWIAMAGFLGNLADSFLGAALQRRGILNNDWVNFLNTLIAAISMILLSIAFS